MASRFDIYVGTLLKTQRWLKRHIFNLQYEKEFGDNRKLSSCVVVASPSPQMMFVAGLERGHNTSYISYISYYHLTDFFAIITNERVDTVDFARVPQVRNLWWKNSWENYIPQRKRCFKAKTFAEQVKRLDHYSVHLSETKLWRDRPAAK